MTDVPPEVLFLCVHNSGRSQMAAALLRRHAGGRIVVHSAGSDPADSVDPAVVEVMAELGIDLSARQPRAIDDVVRRVDVVVTMGCGDTCPAYPGKRYLDWPVSDPVGRSAQDVRPIRDEIDRRARALVVELADSRPRRGPDRSRAQQPSDPAASPNE